MLSVIGIPLLSDHSISHSRRKLTLTEKPDVNWNLIAIISAGMLGLWMILFGVNIIERQYKRRQFSKRYTRKRVRKSDAVVVNSKTKSSLGSQGVSRREYLKRP